MATLRSCRTPDHVLKEEAEIVEKGVGEEGKVKEETKECVCVNLVPADQQTKKSEGDKHTTEGRTLSFDRKDSTLEGSEMEGFERKFVETFKDESDGISASLERSHQERDCGKSVQRVTRQEITFAASEIGSRYAFPSSYPGKITRAKTDTEVSNDNAEKCDFCEGNALLICESCSVFCCEDCMENKHPHEGPYLKHKISPINASSTSKHYDRCKDHGLFEQLFCTYCERNRCTECVKTRCKLHFKGRISDADIENEKSLLLEELEKATARLGFLGRYKENVQQEITNIQMTGLSRREQIRQEFVSFHDLLIQTEEKMLEQLDQEVNERVTHVKNTLQASVETLDKEDVNLTTTVTELVQSSDDTKFIEEYVRAKDLCQQVDVRVREFYRDWARDSIYAPSPILDNYFTMRHEKGDLFEKLSGAMELQKLQFKQNTLFTYPGLQIRLSEYIDSSGTPPSTDVSYTMQLFQKRILVYELTSKSLQDMRLNDLSTYLLVPGLTFLLKVTSEFKCHAFQNKNKRRGNPCHMLISVQNLYCEKQ